MYSYNYYDSTPTTTGAGIWAIVSIVIAVCLAFVLYFTFLSNKNNNKFSGNLKKLYDFLTFKTMSLEFFLKICYLILSIWITLVSFSAISDNFISFLLILIVGNIVIRIVFEWALLFIMMHRRLVEISNNTQISKKAKSKEE